ncbi:hypothetical protein [Dysgonomonas macrotermitis]|uniref:DNA pilot protein n=1 Tax=Dysgonomonas macrotermitis TaxID=1346286 RepID=A0A1M5AGE7_9BACT|nr:hypothetical protein [Dysgonomonas macrotermitis]SHF29323.1 hypothetical protein SAMN05444362_10543 [Dysgonomonas macrotermitis]
MAWQDAALGMGMSIVGDALQGGQSQKLIDQQVNAQKDLMSYGMGLQKDMANFQYNMTSPKAQVAALKKAGLNAGLLYGKGGGMGISTATGSPSGGGVNGGSAEGGSNKAMAAIAQQGMGLQIQKLKSEVALNESVAEKNKADAAKTSGIDTELATGQLNLLAQQTASEVAKRSVMQIEATLMEAQTNKVDIDAKLIAEQISNIQNANDIQEQTKSAIISKVKSEAVQVQLQNMAIQSGIEVNKAQIAQISQLIIESVNRVDQDWQKLATDQRNANTNYENMKINAINAVIKDQQIAPWVLGAKGVQQGIRKIGEFLGDSPYDNAAGRAGKIAEGGK